MVAAKSERQHRSPSAPALGLRLLLLAGLAILLQYVDFRNNHLDTVRKAIGATVYPLRVLVDAPVSAWRWLGDSTSSRSDLQLENSRLNTERLLTRARLQRYAALEAENARLRTMLDATTQVRDEVRVAEIMSVSANPFRHVLVIDKGTAHGVYDGQAMVDAEGVIGQVIETGVASSQCLLISDPGHDLPVEVNRNGLRTIARGTGDFNRLDLPFLPNNADIQAGDLLVTSGLGGVFPQGYPVAVVDTVIRVPQEPFASVTAAPTASLNQVREIMLIWTTVDEVAPEETIENAAEETPDENSEQTGEPSDDATDEADVETVTESDSGEDDGNG